jgi:hypothetical protein
MADPQSQRTKMNLGSPGSAVDHGLEHESGLQKSLEEMANVSWTAL